MTKVSKAALIRAAAVVGVVVLAGCSKEPEELPVSFSKDVMPVLQKHCSECHLPGGVGEVASGLDLSSYENTMKGTKFGAIVRPGDSTSSTLSILTEGRADPSINMPHGDRPPLSKEETGIIAKWINQGAENN
ncbi:hypothetical protein MNBD_GAMMA20-154 [hydrothermal vent metagenome]|uniref:Cytochrome C Planctomycete-type domain-containing protein n=1 Tax=hydrothermal vent metagenome TaxID=652676 RepID=A0A3B1ARK0_9ZZZZ